MFRNLTLSTKILLVVMPLFFLAAGAIVFFNYASQEAATFEQAQAAATVQAMTIKESLVNQMITNYSVDPEFLERVSRAGELSELTVWFFSDSLKLMEEYRTPNRLQRLRETELTAAAPETPHALSVFTTGEPLYMLTCNLGKHPDEPVSTFSANRPKFLQTCEELKAVVPFKAERKCQECHSVNVDDVLGAAHMVIPLSKTTAALRANALRSVGIYVAFTVIILAVGFVVYRKFVARPLQMLVQATEVLGEGNLEHEIVHMFDHDEFGRLASAFEDMQVRLLEAQKELVHKERLSTVGQMASSIIHDFRSPMTGVALGIERLQHNEQLNSDERDRLFTLIKGSVERMNRMMQELLDFSRGGVRLHYDEYSVDEFVQGIHHLIEMDMERKEIHFSCENVYQGSAVLDRDRLQRAVMNILSNAEDATPRGGRITMTVSSNDGLLIFRIADTGPGIAEQIKDRIFEPFATFGKSRGTGLGLAITRRIVEEHYGEINFESEQGKGTIFSIKLPLRPPFGKKQPT
ncbi:MAG: HAMP domain-containing sensor histidine kinase [Bacteroidota bacterium]